MTTTRIDHLNRCRIVRRGVQVADLERRFRCHTDSMLGGSFPLVYAGTNSAGRHVFIVDNPQSSFHGKRLACSSAELPSFAWIEERIPLDAVAADIADDDDGWCNTCGLPIDEFGMCSSLLAGCPCDALVGPL